MNKNKQLALILYEFTLAFCKRYMSNLSEAKLMMHTAQVVKKQLKISYLTQLYEKYEEFLDMNDFETWLGYSLQLRRVKGIAYRPYKSYEMYEPFLSSAERAANTAICLINQISSFSNENKAPLTREMSYVSDTT